MSNFALATSGDGFSFCSLSATTVLCRIGSMIVDRVSPEHKEMNGGEVYGTDFLPDSRLEDFPAG